MNIGIDCRFWGIKHAGLGRYTRELVLAIVRLILEMQDVASLQMTLFFQKGDWLEDKEKLGGCKIVEVDIPHYSFREQLLFWRVVDKEKLDLMHFTHFNVPVLTKTPYVVTIHDLIKHFFKGRPVTTRNELVYWLKYGGYRFTIDKAIQRASHIIVPSYFVKDQICVHYSGLDSKIEVVYEGVSAPYNNHSKLINRNLKIKEKYQLENPFFIYTGSAYPSKDIPTLLKALKQLTGDQSGGRLQLIIACARGHFWQKLEQTVIQLDLTDTVVLPGRVSDEDLIALYKQAVAFVTPSLMEGFGLPGLEALACGCPVIASEAGSLPEIYDKSAIYFQPGNAEDLANKMEQVLQWSVKDRERVRERAIEQAKQFDWEKAGEETISTYKKVLS